MCFQGVDESATSALQVKNDASVVVDQDFCGLAESMFLFFEFAAFMKEAYVVGAYESRCNLFFA